MKISFDTFRRQAKDYLLSVQDQINKQQKRQKGLVRKYKQKH